MIPPPHWNEPETDVISKLLGTGDAAALGVRRSCRPALRHRRSRADRARPLGNLRLRRRHQDRRRHRRRGRPRPQLRAGAGRPAHRDPADRFRRKGGAPCRRRRRRARRQIPLLPRRGGRVFGRDLSARHPADREPALRPAPRAPAPAGLGPEGFRPLVAVRRRRLHDQSRRRESRFLAERPRLDPRPSRRACRSARRSPTKAPTRTARAATTTLGVGGIYHVAGPFSLLFSGGPVFEHGGGTGSMPMPRSGSAFEKACPARRVSANSGVKGSSTWRMK